MHKKVNLQFSVDSVSETDTLATFEAVASESGVMTSHNIMFADGAFGDAISLLKDKSKNLPMLFNHNADEIIGGFPTNSIYESGGKLRMQGNINLAVQRGREVYALIKQEVLTDLSVGIMLDPSADMTYNEDLDVLQIDRVGELYETSVVFIGANPKAKITNFKAKKFKDLPIAASSHAWSKDSAIQSIKEFTASTDVPSQSYKDAFLWCDSTRPLDFNAYKYAFVDVVDDKLKVVPAALRDAAANIEKDESICFADKERMKRTINRHLQAAGEDVAFKDCKSFDEYTIRDCEKFLKKEAGLSESESKCFISKIKSDSRDVRCDDESELESELTALLLYLDLVNHNNK